MKITGAVVIVRLEDGKCRQVDISSEDVKRLLYFHQQRTGDNIDIIEQPIDGLELNDVARELAEKIADFGNVKPMPEWSNIVNPDKQ